MPKCFKCEKALTGNLTLSSVTEKTADLGVKCLFFNTASMNSAIRFYCNVCFKEVVLQIDFVKSAIAGAEFTVKFQNEKKLNETLTTENASLKAQLDSKQKEWEGLVAQSTQTLTDLTAIRAELETVRSAKNVLSDQIANHLKTIKEFEVTLAQKEKEMTDLKAKDIERAKQHASVKIGLKFETYDQIRCLFEEWSTKLKDFNSLEVVNEIHSKIQSSFEGMCRAELQTLKQHLGDQLTNEIDEVSKNCHAHEKLVKETKRNLSETGLVLSQSQSDGMLALLQSVLENLQNRKIQLKEYKRVLTNEPEVNAN